MLDYDLGTNVTRVIPREAHVSFSPICLKGSGPHTRFRITCTTGLAGWSRGLCFTLPSHSHLAPKLIEDWSSKYRGADKSLARPGRKQANISVRIVWISFGALHWRKKSLMTARVLMLLKSRAFLTYFRGCFLPGRAKDLSAPLYTIRVNDSEL